MALIDSNSTVLSIGDPMPMFALLATNGSIVDSSAINAKTLVVIFTCNHCPYAQAYEDRIIALAKEFEAKNVQFVLINSNDATNYPEDSFDAMKEKAQQKNYTFAYAYDESQEVAKSFGALCTPHCFAFDSARVLRYKGRIDDNWKEPSEATEHNLHDAITALARDEFVPITEVNAIGCSIKWK